MFEEARAFFEVRTVRMLIILGIWGFFPRQNSQTYAIYKKERDDESKNGIAPYDDVYKNMKKPFSMDNEHGDVLQ